MNKEYFKRVNRLKGSVQSARAPKALREGYIPIDDRTLSDLIRALAAYADIIQFYDIDNKPAGTWGKLFAESEIVLVAEAAEIDLQHLKQQYHHIASVGNQETIDFTLSVLSGIAKWLSVSKNFVHDESKLIALKIQNYVQQSLLDLMGSYAQLALNLSPKYRKSIKLLCRELLNTDKLRVLQPIKTRQQEQDILDRMFEKSRNIREFMAAECRHLLSILMLSDGHEPAVTMLIAFLEAYHIAQQNINTIPARLSEYYYSRVLGNMPHQGRQERIFLHCKSVLEKPVLIAQGWQFLAGKSPDKKNIIYESEQANLITGARLSSVQTLYLQRHPKIFPENATHAVTRIKHRDLKPEGETTLQASPSIFGYDEVPGHTSQDSEAIFGLCIQSDHLFAKQGERIISLNFEVADRTLQRLRVNSQSDTELPRTEFMWLSEKKCKLANDIFYAFSEKLQKQNVLFQHINLFMSDDFDENIESFKTYDFESLLRQCLLAMYTRSDDIRFLGLIHREINIRRIFFKNYLSDSVLHKMRRKIKRLQNDEESLARSNRMALSQMQLMFRDILQDLSFSDTGILYHYLSDCFLIKLSGESGWVYPGEYSVNRTERHGGICFNLKLSKTDPAVIAPKLETHQIESRYPVLQLLNNNAAGVFPYSFLRGVAVTRCHLRIQVNGVRDLSVQNEYGLVDVTQSFLAFSAAPSASSRMRIGGYEYARKRIDSLRLHIRWKNIPGNFGGFTEYYRAYGEGYDNSNYLVRVQMLAGGELIPQDPQQIQLSPLFEYEQGTNKLLPITNIDFPILAKPPRLDDEISKKAFAQNIRGDTGYINLKLVSKGKLFGHREYNQILSKVLVHNARSKRKKLLPEPPYTPEIDALELDYIAHDEVCFIDNISERTQSDSEDTPQSIAYYITPLGAETSYTKNREGGFTLLPEWPEDGNLFISYEIIDGADSLNIYFQIKTIGSTPQSEFQHLQIDWCYYSRNGWKKLPQSAILSDSTNGFRRSGIVVLELMPDKARHTGFGRGDQFWFRISTSDNLTRYGGLSNILFDAITVRSIDSLLKLNRFPSLFDKPGISSKWQAMPTIPGVQSFLQYEAAVNQSNEETVARATLRINEQLRHKNRAITPWDIERIVLEKYVQIDRAKCLSACKLGEPRPVPGTLSLVVSPKLIDSQNIHAQGHHVNAVVLAEIREHLISLCSPNVQIEVHNARYEIVRVRCAVIFNDPVGSGLRIQQLNNDLCQFLSPWNPTGLSPGLGWRIRTKDVESFIRQLSYVRFVTQVSLLKVYRDEEKQQYFCLEDTAQFQQNTPLSDIDRFFIDASFPWTLPLPSQKHDILLLQGDAQEIAATPVGINSMEIGGTFILREGNPHG